jgi:nucleoside-diphosphate-sugar epimerase
VAPPSDARRPRALVTGLRGFTGHHVAAELADAGYEVHGLTLCDAAGPRDIDLLDADGVRRVVQDLQPDVVLHLAAIAFVAHGDVEAIYRTNILGTRHLLEALARLPTPPRAVVLASSANIYGNADAGLLTESQPPAPANDYAVSKLAMEYAAKLWMDKLPITLARPFNYTGVGQSLQFVVAKIVDHFRRGARVIELGNVEVARDFSDVRDVARSYRALIEAAPAGRTVNLCSGRASSLREVIAALEALAGYRIEIRVNPAFVRSSDVISLAGDPSLLKEITGRGHDVPLSETLEWMYSAAAG